MNEAELLSVLSQKGAILTGHFRLSSGRHSDTFVQKFRVLEHPGLTQSIGAAIAHQFEGSFDLVASPALGAIVLGFSVALAADARFIFAERVDGVLSFRRGFAISPHERVLVVEDVITTGASVKEVVELATDAGGNIAGVGVLLDRADDSRTSGLGVPMKALISLPAESWEAQDCPLCKAGQQLEDPGSRRLRA